MNEETKERLKKIPRARCTVCNTPRSYGNPMAKCNGCGDKYCYDHITAVTSKNGIVDYCDNCL